MSLAEHVRTLGRGPGRSRSLTQDEARDAMQRMLAGDAAPQAEGALLMLLRMKGETADEIAGFAAAAQAAGPAFPPVDLDWPSYGAGRTRGAPWFLLSAQLVARAGHRVLLHGWNGSDPKVRQGLRAAGIGIASDPDAVARLLERDNIAYLPLEDAHPALYRLLALRDVLGLRSCANTVCRMLNPAGAAASVQGVFHPSYRDLQADAAARLGWQALSVIKGGGGEFERHPAKDIAVFGLRNGTRWEQSLAARCDVPRRLSDTETDLAQALSGAELPGFETEIVIGTAALALDTLGHPAPAALAAELWSHRPRHLAA